MSVEDRQLHLDEFERRFVAVPEAAVRAPGRVNLIGDHTDYHEGFVLPMAIHRSVLLYGRRRTDRRLRMYSETLSAGVELDLAREDRHPEALGRYLQGVLAVLGARHPGNYACDVLITGDLPPGGGLSSSSALVVGFAALLTQLYGLRLPPLELAEIGRDAEYWYGTTGGIMDQYVISHARAGQAVLLDCRSLTHQYIAVPNDVAVVIANTGIRHDQIATPFAARRREAEAGLSRLQCEFPEATTLRDIPLDALERVEAQLLTADPSGLLWRRCRHVITENARVLAAAEAIKRGELSEVGRLMAESHASLRDDYEVSSRELEAMVAAAEANSSCLGARLTGGGFGGCTVNLVEHDAAAAFCADVAERYRQATGLQSAVFTAQASDGVQALDLA
jgi:galactokinase